MGVSRFASVLPVATHFSIRTLGNTAFASPAQMQRNQGQSVAEQQCIFFNLLDMPGCSGHEGPAEVVQTTNAPVWTAPRRYNPIKHKIQYDKCKEQLDAGILRGVRRSQYACAATVPATKNANTSWWTHKRVCIDSGQSMKRCFQCMAGAKAFTNLDVRTGFHHILMFYRCQAVWWGMELYQ